MNRWYAVAALGCVGALSLGTPYAAVAEPAGSITLAGERSSATVVGTGLHEADIAVDGWFQVERELKHSTLWVGESIIAPSPTTPEYYLTMTNRSGEDCKGAGDGTVGEYLFDHELRGGTVSSGRCSGDTVWVGHAFGTTPDYGDRLASVAIWEEPPVWDDLPEPGMSVAWNGAALDSRGGAELGTSFAEAPELVGGTWNVTLYAGKPAVLKVPLDWNQHVQVSMELFGPEIGELAQVTPRLYNPLGGRVDWATPVASASGTQPPERSSLPLNISGYTGGAVSPSIRYRNREEGSAAAFAGDYYVSLEVEDNTAMPEGSEVTVSVRVVTDGPIASPYKQEPEPLPVLADAPGEAPVETPTDESTAVASDAGDDSTGASSGSADRPWPAAVGCRAGTTPWSTISTSRW